MNGLNVWFADDVSQRLQSLAVAISSVPTIADDPQWRSGYFTALAAVAAAFGLQREAKSYLELVSDHPSPGLTLDDNIAVWLNAVQDGSPPRKKERPT